MDGLDHLAKLLAFVKRDGLSNAFEQDLRYGGDVENVNFRAYPEPLRSLRHCLEESKLCMAALNSIKTRLATKIRNLQRRCKPLVLEFGMKRIPDEILASIFEAGHHMSEYYPFALRVSHVSHRFRQVSLWTPSLWTRLSSRYPAGQVESYIPRSGQLDLHVELCEDTRLTPFTSLLYPLSCRWSRLSLVGFHGPYNLIMHFIGLTQFPRLRYISHDGFDVEPATSVSKCHMPLLSHLEGYHSHFPLGVSFPFLHQLTNVDLCFDEDDEFDIKSFADILYRMVSLRNLVLEFRGFELDGWDDSDLEIAVPQTRSPHSFHIESLKVTFRDNVGKRLIISLYDILEYMTAQMVDFSLLNHGEPHSFCNSQFPHGSTIRLHIGQRCSLSKTLQVLFENCKILRSVEFDRSSFSPFMKLKLPHLSSFRHLRLHDCVMVEEYIEPMVKSLFTHEEFQSLEIFSCPKLSEQFLLDLQDEVGERLTWKL